MKEMNGGDDDDDEVLFLETRITIKTIPETRIGINPNFIPGIKTGIDMRYLFQFLFQA